MKSKPSTNTISYNTDEITKQRAGIAVTANGVSMAQLVRNAIHEFADSVERRKDRTEALTVILNETDTQLIKDAAQKTGLTLSAVIHECLVMYVMVHKEEIKSNMARQLEQANIALAA